MIYYGLYGSPTHNTNQCHTLDSIVVRLDRSKFWVNEGPQGFGGGHQGGGGYLGGRIGGRGLVCCYNCNEKGNIARDFLLPIKRP